MAGTRAIRWRLIEAAGCHMLFLQTSSPDFSWIEWAFSSLETKLRQTVARPHDELTFAIADGPDHITGSDAKATRASKSSG